jgi:NAD(P)-dependent dehydrogenase (short-subunit alcohol dehydrogenase family)
MPEIRNRPSEQFLKYANMFIQSIPWGGWVDPTRLPTPLCFLASEKSEYITGTTIEVDGGAIAGRYHLPKSR